MIIALHGFGSSGEKSSTVQAIKEFFKDEDVRTPSYDITNPFKLASDLRKIARECPEDEILTVVGISFGGFFARWLANDVNAQTLVMLNPVLDSTPRLEARLGVNESFVQGDPIVVTEQMIEAYKAFKVDVDNVNLEINVLLGEADDIIDPGPTVEYYKTRANVELIKDADHRFTGFKDTALAFVGLSVGNICG